MHLVQWQKSMQVLQGKINVKCATQKPSVDKTDGKRKGNTGKNGGMRKSNNKNRWIEFVQICCRVRNGRDIKGKYK